MHTLEKLVMMSSTSVTVVLVTMVAVAMYILLQCDATTSSLCFLVIIADADWWIHVFLHAWLVW